MIKDEYLDIKHGEYFNDKDHLNEEGSKMFTAALWDVVNDRDKDQGGIVTIEALNGDDYHKLEVEY